MITERKIALKNLREGDPKVSQWSEELCADKELILVAVKKDGRALYFAAEELKSDKHVVLTAIEQDSYALRYASPEMQKLLSHS